MCEISDDELTEIRKAGKGYLVNARNDRKKLHRSGCEAVKAMVASAYPKIFFDELNAACAWLDDQYGSSGWERCGLCRPYSD